MSGSELTLAAMNGTGKVSTSNANLLEIPSLKALKKKLGAGQLKQWLDRQSSSQASAAFSISEGVFYSRNLKVMGSFTGEAKLDLPRQQIEATLVPGEEATIEYRASGKIGQPGWEIHPRRKLER